MSKRTLDTFFKPTTTATSAKRPKPNNDNAPPGEDIAPPDTHPSYPIPIPQLPSYISIALTHRTPAKEPRAINNQLDLDLLYFQPYIARPTANELFKFLRRELPFYRVQYTIKRGGVETEINTPRYTTVFGVDETAKFTSTPKPKDTVEDENDTIPPNIEPARASKSTTSPLANLTLVETTTNHPIRSTKYQYTPRPIPTCLIHLKNSVESATGARYNFCLINYYASGNDSIAFHSDDERFLGGSPDIASLSLGGEREFVMKPKPPASAQADKLTTTIMGSSSPGQSSTSTTTTTAAAAGATQPLKMPLSSGDMVVMRGPTQSNWLHSIPKRKGRGGESVRGRINITFRRAMVPAGTNNYYRYNVGVGPVWRWDEAGQEMVKMQTEEGMGANLKDGDG